MSVTQSYKLIQFSVFESAVIYSALGEYSDKLNGKIEGGQLPIFAVNQMKIELAAVEAALTSISHAKVEVVNFLKSPTVSA